MEAFPRRTENRVEGEVVLWGNRRILFLKIFAITDGGSSHYQDVRKAASLCGSYMVEMRHLWRKVDLAALSKALEGFRVAVEGDGKLSLFYLKLKELSVLGIINSEL